MKVKEFFTNLSKSFANIFARFPVTTVSTIFFTLFMAIFMDNDFISNQLFRSIMYFGIYFTAGALLTEALNKNRTFSYYIFATIAAVLAIMQHLKLFNDSAILLRIILCYVLTLIILSIYFLYKQSKINFESYILRLSANLFKITCIYAVLAIGIILIYSIFVYLILDIDFSLLFRLEIVLFGIYYITNIIYSLVDVKEEPSIFFRGLVKYVLTPLLVIAFAIIYVYIIKILIFRNMPKNQVFRILSALFIVGMPIWTMAQHYKGDDLSYKISSKLPIAFIPFVLLQMYSMGIRIIDNGFTPARYCSVILILFEIIYICMYIWKKDKIHNLLILLNALIIISVILPGINMFSVSNVSQYNRFKVFFEKTSHTDEEKADIYSAYQYLKTSVGGEKYIKDLIYEDVQKIKQYHTTTSTYTSNYEYITAKKGTDKIDIAGYSYLYPVAESAYQYSSNNIDFLLEVDNITINIDNIINDYIKFNYTSYNEEEFDNYFESNNEFELDANTKLIIQSLRITYTSTDLEVSSYSIDGYLLVK